ncbi:MAG: tail fiber domain-containing protein [Bacteroidales bacterium]|jgi:hypothetical protein|nr:tail fiber domain-containing protein [Bacteroidales bacterium]
MKKEFLTLAISTILSISVSAQLQVDSEGDVGIGTTTPSEQLELYGNNNKIKFSNTGDNATGLLLVDIKYPTLEFAKIYYTTNSNYIHIWNAGSGNGININDNGYVGINKLPSYTLDVNGTIHGTSIQPSDRKLKGNIKPFDTKLCYKIDSLKAYSYNYKTYKKISKQASKGDSYLFDNTDFECVLTDSLESRLSYGFIAQDVQKIYPELVYENDSSGMLAINYDGFIPILWEANKTLNHRLAYLEARIDYLETNMQISQQNAKKSQAITASSSENISVYTQKNIHENAEVYVLDLTGKMVHSFSVNDTGNIVIPFDTLQPGMYTCAIIVDSQLNDTKTVMITQ